MTDDHFADKSKLWDLNPMILNNAKEIAKAIKQDINLNSNMKLMDFGAGTGLLSYFIASDIDCITAIDNSPSMLEKLTDKLESFECKVEVIEKDLSIDTLDKTFNGIISSMTIHHLEDTKALFSKFYTMLEPKGFIAIADLDTEDGTFHSDNTGVFHYGFNRDELTKIAKEVGFLNISFETVSTIKKPQCDFSVFLMTAYK